MSVKNEERKLLEEELETEVVDLEREAKKAKIVSIAKKVLKVIGVAAVGVIGFVVGNSVANKAEEDSEIIDEIVEAE